MTPALDVRDLSKTYQGGLEALSGVDLSVDEGDFFALLGPNGAGKSTLIGIVASLVNKTGGTVAVFGHDLDQDPEGVKACIGLVPQEFNFNLFLPVQEVLLNQAGYYGVPRRRGEGAGRALSQTARPLGAARHRDAQALGRHETARHDRPGTGPRASAIDPRRADRGGGHRDPPLHVGLPARAQRRGHHHHPHHPLSGGGREPLPQPRHHRSWTHRRALEHRRLARQAPDRDLRAQPQGTPGGPA